MTESEPVGDLRILIIANPAAGRATPELVAELVELCARCGGRATVGWTSAPGDATALAARAAAEADGHAGRTVVVSVGGDGTTVEVAAGLTSVPSGTRPALFVVPGGTGNSTYRALWGERPWQQALATAVTAPERHLRRLDLARVLESGELVVLGAGAGLSALVLVGARGVRLSGPQRLQAGLERAMAEYRAYPGRVTVDGRVVHEGPTLFANVGGGPYRAWQYLVLPHSVLDDGLLDVCVMDDGVPLGEVQPLLRAGGHLAAPGTVYTRGRQVVLERTDGEPLVFEHDGELIAAAGRRVSIEVLPGALPVLCDPEPAALPEPTGAAPWAR